MKSVLALLILINLAVACSNTPPQQDNSLYQQLGGDIGIDQLVVTSIQLLHKDDRVAFLFEDIDENNLILQLSEQLCSLSSGPCQYDGLTMEDAHAGMDLNKAEFDIFVEVFIAAMRAEGIPFTTQNQLLALLAPMRPEIIHQ